MDGFEPMSAPSFGKIARELTPDGYVEAPYVMKIDGKYHLMYSSGSWTNGTYCVKAATSDSPCEKFVYYADILSAGKIADGPGHNSAFCYRGKWYVAYHRREIGDTNPHHRRLCIDELPIVDGKLTPVTRLCPAPFLYIKEGVGKQASAPSMQTERSDKLREVEGEGAVECF